MIRIRMAPIPLLYTAEARGPETADSQQVDAPTHSTTPHLSPLHAASHAPSSQARKVSPSCTTLSDRPLRTSSLASLMPPCCEPQGSGGGKAGDRKAQIAQRANVS